MITKEAFLSLRPGIDRVMDAEGGTHGVLSNTTVGSFPDVPGPREIVLVDEKNYEWRILGWDEATGKIMDDKFNIVIELNNDRAIVIVG